MRPHSDTVAAFKVTLGIWFASAIIFAIYVMIERGGVLPVWSAVWLVLIAVTGIFLSWPVHATARAFAGLTTIRRWLILAPLIVTVATVQAVLDSLVFRLVRVAFDMPLGTPSTLQASTLNFLIYIWLFGMYAVAVDLIAMTSRAERLAREAVEAQNLARQAQLDVLRFQLNPHFLFNTLNNISALVITGRNAQAEGMISRLSRFLRAALDTQGEAVAPLRSELASIQAYLDIEAARFREPLSVQIDCPEALTSALAPCLILQPLVENAIKYAVAPSRGVATVRITVRREAETLVLSVEDSGPGRQDAATSVTVSESGIGLSNIQDRLATLYGPAAGLTTRRAGEGFRADIRLPWRTDR